MKEEIFIPSPLAEQIKLTAAEQGMTADEFVEKAISKFLRSENYGR